jgi:putative restriction endonuclease
VLPVKSFEVQKEIKRLTETERPKDYDPLDLQREKKTLARTASIRARGFRQAVIESYDCRCCVCGLKIPTPDFMAWEVEAAHIVPHGSNGRDDVWNGIALCKFHHWAFDTGWFSLSSDCRVIVSSRLKKLPGDFGKAGDYDLFRNTLYHDKLAILPKNLVLHPHPKSLEWHRQHIFHA